MTEFDEDIEQTIANVSLAVQDWSERTPTQLASTLFYYSIPTLLEIITRTQETRHEELLHQTLAKMVLARYAKENGDLEEFKAELWEVFQAADQRLPTLQSFLRQIQELCIQQMHQQPGQDIYLVIRKFSQELLVELRQKPFRRTVRRKKRTVSVKLAQTSELPELSQLTFQPIDQDIEDKIFTSTLSTLPVTLRIPTLRQNPELIVHLEKIPDWQNQEEELLYWLPEMYGILDQWNDSSSPIAMAETLHSLSANQLLRYSAYLLPHPNQEFFLRYIGILIHLKLLTDHSLPYLNEALRQLISLEDPLIEPFLPTVFYYVYCSSHSFYAIQEQAIKKLGFQLSYLYHLITQEWHKNKLINNFTRASLSRNEQKAVKNLSSFDWEFIFLLLHRGWSRSVIRDVYGVFHGSSTFANQIVQPETSVGFGDLKETGKGISLTLATQQISDILKNHKKRVIEDSTKEQQFEQFIQERFKRDILKKDTRPNLNSPTLKRLKRFINQGIQRGEQAEIEESSRVFYLVRDILIGFSHLSSDRIGWLVYDLVRYTLGASSESINLELFIKGSVRSILYVFATEIHPKRDREAWTLAEEIWSAFFYSLMDQGFLEKGNFETTADLKQELVKVLDNQRSAFLEDARKQFFMGILS